MAGSGIDSRTNPAPPGAGSDQAGGRGDGVGIEIGRYVDLDGPVHKRTEHHERGYQRDRDSPAACKIDALLTSIAVGALLMRECLRHADGPSLSYRSTRTAGS